MAPMADIMGEQAQEGFLRCTLTPNQTMIRTNLQTPPRAALQRMRALESVPVDEWSADDRHEYILASIVCTDEAHTHDRWIIPAIVLFSSIAAICAIVPLI